MKNPLSTFIIFVMACVLSTATLASRPEAVLEGATAAMLSAMKANSGKIKSNPNYVVSIVERVIVPHVDKMDMAKLVVGKSAWQAATQSQRVLFASEFKKLVIRTYASSFSAYNNQVIEYLPIRGSIDGKRRVQVQSLIKESGKENIRVAYRLVKAGNSWRVYDIIIEGVSILKGFQSQFAPAIRSGGVAKAIEVIKQHNARPL